MEKTYTQKELDNLILCKKKISKPPRSQVYKEGAHYRNDMKLQSEDGKHDFSVFIRQHAEFEEDFSIGLVYHPRDGSKKIILIRCNGPHNSSSNLVEYDLHFDYHIHIAKDFNINEGKKDEKYKEATNEYINLYEAIHYFINKCNIEGAEKYFNLQKVKQVSLFDIKEINDNE